MKKVFLIAALIVSGTATLVHAQNPVSDNKTANLSITVSDVRTITVNSGTAPTFVLGTPADYTAASTAAGLPASTATNLTVLSRAGYKVKATLSNHFANANPTGNGSATIPGNYLGITLGAAVTTTGNEPVPSTSIATKTPFGADGSTISQILSTPANTGGTLGTTFDINYSLYNFPGVINLAMGTFTADVTYTIEAM